MAPGSTALSDVVGVVQVGADGLDAGRGGAAARNGADLLLPRQQLRREGRSNGATGAEDDVHSHLRGRVELSDGLRSLTKL